MIISVDNCQEGSVSVGESWGATMTSESVFAIEEQAREVGTAKEVQVWIIAIDVDFSDGKSSSLGKSWDCADDGRESYFATCVGDDDELSDGEHIIFLSGDDREVSSDDAAEELSSGEDMEYFRDDIDDDSSVESDWAINSTAQLVKLGEKMRDKKNALFNVVQKDADDKEKSSSGNDTAAKKLNDTVTSETLMRTAVKAHGKPVYKTTSSMQCTSETVSRFVPNPKHEKKDINSYHCYGIKIGEDVTQNVGEDTNTIFKCKMKGEKPATERDIMRAKCGKLAPKAKIEGIFGYP